MTRPALLWLGRGRRIPGPARSTTCPRASDPQPAPAGRRLDHRRARPPRCSPKRPGPRRAARGRQQARLQARADARPTLSLDLKSTIVEKQSRNVIGRLHGSTHPDEAMVLHGALGPPRQASRTSRRRQHLQRRRRQRHRRRRHPRDRRGLRAPAAAAAAFAAVRRGHAGGVGPARLAVLRRASGDPAGQDRRR